MGKLLLWIGVVAVVVAMMKLSTILQRKSERAADRRVPGRSGKGELMLRCDHCGVHFPAEEAERDAGHVYCSPEHRRAGARP
ncbi:MAG: hypothetical protein H6934_09215 [Burkholderiaceae bacterium]|nr:hypothetical protein [Burkholderiaceae bacterium]